MADHHAPGEPVNRSALLVAVLLAACAKNSPASSSEAAKAPPGHVCCESFGYGSGMVKCCESFSWTQPDACAVGPDHAGGGMEIVADAKCAGAPLPK